MPDPIRTDSLAAGNLFSNPLYREVTIRISQSLAEGEWKPGEAIPSEAKLAQRYNVSIGTIRKAIDTLVAENILVRQPGRGTFVINHSPNRYMFQFFHVVGDDGSKEFPTVELLSFTRGKADAESADTLSMANGARVYRITNRLFLQNRPVIIDEIVLPEALFPKLDEKSYRGRDNTIYGFYQQRYAINVIRTSEKLKAVRVNAEQAKLLDLKEGDPALGVYRVAYTFNNVPVEIRRSLVNSNIHHYVLDQQSGK